MESFPPLEQSEVAGFRLVRALGSGRFSHSWLAEDADSRPFVLKLLRRQATDPEAVGRFVEEAERLVAAPELNHPNVARPVAAGVHRLQTLVLVYDSGGETTLAEELRQRGRVAPERALDLCAQVCDGLAAAHLAGVLHRDLKPANVGLTRLGDGTEQAVLLDVATSHLLAGIGLRDQGVLPLSSAACLSPEEASGRHPDARSDLYAAGVLLFQLISGRLPVMGATAEELLRAHRSQRPLRLRDAGSKVHDDLETLVSRLLAKDPAHRPANAGEVAQAMRALVPVAECSPEDDAPEPVDDPLSIDLSRSERVPPPPMDSGLDPEILAESAPRGGPQSPAWKRFAFPRWTGPAAAAAGTLVAVVLALQLWPASGSEAQAPEVAASSAAPLPAARAVPAAPEAAPDVAPVPPEPAAPSSVAPSRWVKSFDRAQKALRAGHAYSARTILRAVLGKHPLSRSDRARASKLMGDAEAKLGHRASAASWWRKSLQLYEDPEDRARVSQLLQPHR